MTLILILFTGFAAGASVSKKPDRWAVIYGKCVEIERLSKKKSALKCLDRFLDRMDVEVGDIETRLLTCGERRRLEDLANGEHIREVVTLELTKLRNAQAESIEANLHQLERSSEKVGPRKMKEIELRAAEQHSKRVRQLASLVCSRPAFTAFLKRR